jgi:hypothetical protein
MLFPPYLCLIIVYLLRYIPIFHIYENLIVFTCQCRHILNITFASSYHIECNILCGGEGLIYYITTWGQVSTKNEMLLLQTITMPFTLLKQKQKNTLYTSRHKKQTCISIVYFNVNLLLLKKYTVGQRTFKRSVHVLTNYNNVPTVQIVLKCCALPSCQQNTR